MSWPMKDLSGWGSEGTGSGCCEGMSPFFLPVPMAIFGVVVAFMFGVLVGSAVSRKRAMMMSGGWSGGMHSKHIRGHHHHGHGALACRERHDDWPRTTVVDAEPGGNGE